MKVTTLERDAAIEQLRRRLPTGAMVYTSVRHVTRTGNASVAVYQATVEDERTGETVPSISDISWRVSRALGFSMDADHGGVKVGYMGERRDAALVHDLARVLHGSSTALRQVDL